MRGPSWSWWPCPVKCKKSGKFKHGMWFTHRKFINHWSSCIIMWLLHSIPRAHGFDASPSGTRYIPWASSPGGVPDPSSWGVIIYHKFITKFPSAKWSFADTNSIKQQIVLHFCLLIIKLIASSSIYPLHVFRRQLLQYTLRASTTMAPIM